MEFCILQTRVLMSNLTGSRVISYHFCSLLARSFLHPLYRVICKTIAKRVSLLDIKWLCSFGCAVILDHKLEDLEFERETMEFVIYVAERLVDIFAALILRAGYRLIDQFFATGANGETGDIYVPLGTPIRTGSGGVLSSIGGGGSHRNSIREQPVDESEDVIGGNSTVLDFPSLD